MDPAPVLLAFRSGDASEDRPAQPPSDSHALERRRRVAHQVNSLARGAVGDDHGGVQPTVDALILTPIAPHTLTNRPIVIPASASVRVQPHMEARDEVVFTLDGQTTYAVQPGDEIAVQRAPRPMRLIRPTTRSYFEVLRTKLKWGER